MNDELKNLDDVDMDFGDECVSKNTRLLYKRQEDDSMIDDDDT